MKKKVTIRVRYQRFVVPEEYPDGGTIQCMWPKRAYRIAQGRFPKAQIVFNREDFERQGRKFQERLPQILEELSVLS